MTENPAAIKLKYIIGYIISLILTIITFIIAGKRLLTHDTLFFVIISMAIIQLFVQLKCFLHFSLKSDAKWNVLTFAFTMIILLALVIGSIWIMFSLAHQMMM